MILMRREAMKNYNPIPIKDAITSNEIDDKSELKKSRIDSKKEIESQYQPISGRISFD